MIEQELADEMKMLKNTIVKFSEKEIKPVAASLDQSAEFQDDLFHRVFRGLAELGFLGLLIPEEYGGSGSNFVSVAVVLEELGRVSPGIAFSYLAQTPVMTYANIYVNGTEEQKKKYVRPMCRGEIMGANAVTEPDAGSDLFNIRTTVVEEKDCFVLNGSKTFITNARVAKVFYVLAKDKGTPDKMSSFLVDRDCAGLSVGRDLDKCGYRAAPTSEVFFEDCRIGKDCLLGQRGRGLNMTLSEIELQRIYLACIALGLSEAAFAEAVRYAKERIQFGKRIAEFQMVQAKLADMASNIEVVRTVNHRAVMDYQRSREKGKKGRSLLALIAKKVATAACVAVVTDAVEIHGAYGFVKEYPVERYYREAKLLDVVAGSNDILKILIAREVLK